MVCRRDQIGRARTRFGLHLLRNGIHFGSQYLWATSITLLPLATGFRS